MQNINEEVMEVLLSKLKAFKGKLTCYSCYRDVQPKFCTSLSLITKTRKHC